MKTYLSASRWRKVNHKDFAWASIQNLWCVNGGKYLARQNSKTSTFNRVISRPEAKQDSGQNDSWIAGSRSDPRNNVKAESKKVFSFKNPARTFGFVESGPVGFTTMKEELTKVWGNNGWKLFAGNEIINHLFAEKEDRS